NLVKIFYLPYIPSPSGRGDPKKYRFIPVSTFNPYPLRGDLLSDAASVLPFTQALLDLSGLRFMRDPTRGGLARVAHEICRATGLQVNLNQASCHPGT
ncbi:MAG: hypothetical protein KZQ86_01920, partial [Candidatus Thiodiazotropha sp. (ex Lucinoma kastoroae)]|nr:hypothetical protein [Candidatus Thiodiazotropha sp. (ex Lucinoma kastoroae)]